jgi:type I restriction enzyme R subunit
LAPLQEEIFLQDYFEDPGGKEPRYYQRIAINKAIEAISEGENH